MLNGKVREEFENYIQNLEVAPYVVMLDSIPKCYLNALIIEWLSTLKTIDWERIFYEEYRKTKFMDSQLATTNAIEKSNKILNK